MGSQYDENRYSRNRSEENRNNDEHDHEGGFFERIGNGIRDAWNSITTDEEDHYTGRSNLNGPPYGSNSASNQEYRW